MPEARASAEPDPGERPPLVVVCGPTASGKSDLALALAEDLGGEIVVADSMQVFRGLDVGTAKPDAWERQRVRHHVLDVVDPGEPFSAADFRDHALRAVHSIHARGAVPVVVGGTGLYLRALLDGLVPAPPADAALRARYRAAEAGDPGWMHRALLQVDPATATRLHPRDLVRLERALEVREILGRPLSDLHAEHRFSDAWPAALRLRVDLDPQGLRDRIDARAGRMWGAGWADEVRVLLERGVPRDARGLAGLGYARVVRHVLDGVDATETLTRIQADTRHLARRQRNWFGSDPRAVSVPPTTQGLAVALVRVRAFLHDARASAARTV